MCLPFSFFFSSRRRHTRWPRDWSSDVCSSDLGLREVRAELVEHERAGRLPLGGAAGRRRLLALVARQALDDLLAHGRGLGLEAGEHLDGCALSLAQQTQQDVLGADVVVPQLERLALAELEHLLRARREGDVPRGGLVALADDVADLLTDRVQGDTEGLEGLGADAFGLADQTPADVLGAGVAVVEQPGPVLGCDDGAAGAIGEAFEHGPPPS